MQLFLALWLPFNFLFIVKIAEGRNAPQAAEEAIGGDDDEDEDEGKYHWLNIKMVVL